jgi:EF hand
METDMPARICAALILSAAVLSSALADGGRPPVRAARPKSAGKKSRRVPPLTEKARRVAEELKAKLPPKSEARLMLDAILHGRMGPNDGWFGVAKGRTRFGWDYVAKTFDRNKDAKVTRKEFGGNPFDFRRLDRNRDGVLTAADFDGAGGRSPSPGAMLFAIADRDGNGHVTRKEFEALFKSLDSGKRGFLSLDDLKNGLQPPPRRPRGKGKRSGRPTPSMLVQALARQELGALEPGPELNAKAPDFSLRIVNELKRVTLSKEIGDKPVVLVFGSFT